MDSSDTGQEGKVTGPRAPFPLVFAAGGDSGAVGDDPLVTFVDLRGADDAEQLLAALSEAGVTSADLRTQTLLLVGEDPADRDRALVAYAALSGLAGRPVHVAASPEGPHVDGRALRSQVQQMMLDRGAPDERHDHFQVGAVRDDLPSGLLAGTRLSAALEVADAVRWARRIRFVAPDLPLDAVQELLVIGSLRRRGRADRLPYLVDGSEPADAGDDVGVCLNEVQRRAVEMGRATRTWQSRVVQARPVPARRVRLMEAASHDPAEVLGRLGSVRDDTSGLWRCPRLWRHRSDDDAISIRVDSEGVRCMRCDGERLDPLRLTTDTLNVSPDEAADFLIDGGDPPVGAPHRSQPSR